MAPEKAPQINLLSHESRRKAITGGLATLLSRTPALKDTSAYGHNGNGNNHKAPQISLLSPEPRHKVITGGLVTLLRKHPVLPASVAQNIAGNGHRVPGFKLLTHEPRRAAIRSGFKSLFLKIPPPQPLIIGQEEVGAKGGPRLTAFISSCLLHFAIVFFLLEVPFMLLLPQQSQNIRLPQIVYEFHEIQLPRDLPSVKPPGPGGQPGKGTEANKPPAKGSTAYHPSVTVVSNPPNPDNNFQTIIQPRANPLKRINVNLHLPNVVLSGSLPVPGPPPPMKLSVPSTLKSLTVPKVSVVSVNAPNLSIPPSDMPNMPAIPVPPPPLPPLEHAKAAPKTIDLTAIATQGVQATSNGSVASLLSLSMTPGPPTEKLSIPAGNRYGAFTISPSGTQPGTPNGSEHGSPSGGTGGPGNGGDASTGTGTGHVGGGGGGTATNGLTVSTSGSPAAAGTANNSLPASMLARLVYPILRPPPKNRFAMVVTAGPVGGGGLHVFGVLKGGKVYTIFLPMPLKNWILQYSMVNNPKAAPPVQRNGATLQIEFGIVPPAVDTRFDFHRPNLTAEEKKQMIILHGFIGADGSVEKLTVYKGVQNIADQAAVAAFSKWKFQPAVKDSKPVPIEILLGIPLS